MSFDLSKIVSSLGDDVVAKLGEQVGLSPELAQKAVSALVAHFGQGRDAAMQAAAETTGVGQEVVAAFLEKLADAGKDMALEAAKEKGSEALDAAKEQAMAALAGSDVGKQASGLLGKLFGKK